MKTVEERFLEYVKIDTKSDPKSSTQPSSEIQFDLGRILEAEMKELGLSNVELDDKCNLYGFLPSNSDKDIPKVGFLAHMDTSFDFSGKDVNPRIIENYDGKDIQLNKDVILSPTVFPELLDHVGLDLIVTDGNTLLGADDKAGIAEILTAMEYLITHPEIEHGDIYVAFTPDEEIGEGVDTFNLEKFKPDFAYTIDGGRCGEIQFENFNAASGHVTIKGSNVHPGASKNKMTNSIAIAMELDSLLPIQMRPQYTERYEGFFHLNEIKGNVEETTMNYIIRDHDREKFEEKKNLLQAAADYLNKKYPNTVFVEIKDSYYNMREVVEPKMEIIDLVVEAMGELDIVPIIEPIRGGTDGARLSFMGIPCPNIFTGGMNAHGKFEYVAIQSMEKATELIIKIVENLAK